MTRKQRRNCRKKKILVSKISTVKYSKEEQQPPPQFPAPPMQENESFENGETKLLRLLDFEYDENRHLVIWHVIDVEPFSPTYNQKVRLAYLDSDLLSQFGISTKHTNVEIINLFSTKIKEREHPFRMEIRNTFNEENINNWISKATKNPLDSSIWDDMLRSHDDLDAYPYHEVINKMQDDEMYQKLKIQLFGVDDCDNCKKMKEDFQQSKIPFEYIDANADENQVYCDKKNIDEVPHLYIHSFNRTVFQYVGVISSDKLRKIMVGLMKSV